MPQPPQPLPPPPPQPTPPGRDIIHKVLFTLTHSLGSNLFVDAPLFTPPPLPEPASSPFPPAHPRRLPPSTQFPDSLPPRPLLLLPSPTPRRSFFHETSWVLPLPYYHLYEYVCLCSIFILIFSGIPLPIIPTCYGIRHMKESRVRVFVLAPGAAVKTKMENMQLGQEGNE